jgi:iron complex outermembrane receptor protein
MGTWWRTNWRVSDKIQTSKFTGDFLDATSKSNSLDAKISGDLIKLGDIQTQYAAGLQSRRESYVTSPSAAYQSGDIAGLGGQQVPIDRSRTVNSVFGEVVVPVLKTLEANASVRNDRYNDIGASTTYKANIRWQPVKTVVLRASVGTGFRAPTLVDLWTPQTLGTSEAFNDPATNQTGLQVNQVSGGNPNLKPEI